MRTVTLGATSLEVTPLAYGTWQFGGDWGPVDERAAMAAIGHARSLGINFFDTAQAYGFGRSERLLGQASPSAAAPPSPSWRWPGCWPTRPSRSPSSVPAPQPTWPKASAPST